MEREELLSLRKSAYEEYRKRVQLGEFDTNASAIQLLLHTVVDLINHALEEQKYIERALKESKKKT